MLISVEDFRTKIFSQPDNLVDDLQLATGRYGEDEAESWRQSLPKLAHLLCSPSLQCLHIYVQKAGHVALEYQLPASGAFADVVLLGAHEGRPAAVILELKDWVTRSDRPGKAEGLIERRGSQVLHPSDQVRGYVEYCKRFNSGVQDRDAAIHGCALLTRDFVSRPYTEPPNDLLVAQYPIFTLSSEDCSERIPKFLCGKLSAANEEFAIAFAEGTYRQQRGFVHQIARQILSSKSRTFELVDNQRRAFSLCKAVALDVVSDWLRGSARKRVIVVVGPPGSGKSAVAAKLWAELSLKEELPDGDLVFVTTSMSQNSNWAAVFQGVGVEGARGVIRKATAFHPITTHRVGQLRKKHGEEFLEGVADWRDHLRTLQNFGEQFRDGANNDSNLIAIVDEAHSLINPTKDGGVGQFGFQPTLGPQAYHIIRTSTLTMFFLDPQQGFRHRENTTLEDLNSWSRELGAGDCEIVDLSGVQFRCGGSTEYVSWVESLLEGSAPELNRIFSSAWYVGVQPNAAALAGSSERKLRGGVAEEAATYAATASVTILKTRTAVRAFDFRILDDPASMEQDLRAAMASGKSGRLLSSYSRPWVTRGTVQPHQLPPSLQDFCETFGADNSPKTWSRIWNFVRAGSDDYSQFVQGSRGSAIGLDPLCEVGCPYAVRGFDYDFVGLLWLEDLVWRDGEWLVDLNYVRESGISRLVRDARNEPRDGGAYQLVLKKVTQAYRILLTRALKGLFVWVKDVETRDHLRRSLV